MGTYPAKLLNSSSLLKKQSYKNAIFILGFFLALSCGEVNEKTLPASTGKTGEIIVVLEDRFIGSIVEESLRNCLECEHPALPQPEALFRISIVPKSAFTGLLKNHKNLLIVKYNKKDPALIEKKDIWAYPQIVCRISGSSEKMLANFITAKSNIISSAFAKEERRRLIKRYNKIKDIKISSFLQEKHSLVMSIPKGFSIAKKEKHFTWIRKETAETSLGLLVYDVPYKDSTSLFLSSMLSARDSVTKRYIPGPAEKSYMSTMKEFVPISKKLYFDNHPSVELRGLWNVVGDFMGGPFIGYNIVDEKRNRIVCIEGYVYAPKYNKRRYIRQLESILLSTEIQSN